MSDYIKGLLEAMSNQLGPIHHWLYDQIGLVDERTESLVSLFQSSSTEKEANQIRAHMDDKFGEGIKGIPIEQAISPSNIHGDLSSLIERVECREACMVTAFNGSADKLQDYYFKHGKGIGTKIQKNSEEEQFQADQIYNVIQNIVLVGMPCDRVVEVVYSHALEAVWRQSEVLQASNWQCAGADRDFMFELRGKWLSGLVEALNSMAKYELRFFTPGENPASEEAISVGQ